MDGQLALLVQRGDQTDKKVTEHEARLDVLERGRWQSTGAAAVIGSVAGFLAQYLIP
ncbi:hypothetical protein ACFV0R_19150 [Streptomyces sp. NPDC059578]|uniref:hypothetical protein n=1 Tax=Streptomyces sp. NPDC059578 TaxID=3346874 RepID=UPI003696F360